MSDLLNLIQCKVIGAEKFDNGLYILRLTLQIPQVHSSWSSMNTHREVVFYTALLVICFMVQLLKTLV